MLLVELLLTLPVSNATGEKSFSLINRINIDSRASLSQPILSSLIRICIEGPQCDLFDPIPTIILWNDSVKAKRPNQKKRRNYKKKENTKSDQ